MEVATDFTMWALFARATITVKLVMILLIVASVWCWAVIVDKTLQYRRARKEASIFDRAFWSGEPLDALFEQIGDTPRGPSEKIFSAGMLEWRRSHKQDGGLIAGAQARIDRSMDVAIAKADKEIAAKSAESEAAIAEIRAGALKSVKDVAKDTAKELVSAMGGKADAKTLTAAINARMKG